MGITVSINNTYAVTLDELLEIATFSKAQKELDELRADRDQLKAQVERLRAELSDAIDCWHDNDPFHLAAHFTALQETPAQSLLLNNADVLEEYAKALPQVSTDCITDNDYLMDAMDCSEWMIEEANALRQQAKEDKS